MKSIFTRFRSLMLITALLTFLLPHSVGAVNWGNYDINAAWGNHSRVKWNSTEGCLEFEFRFFCEEGNDDWLKGCYISADGTDILYFSSWNQKNSEKYDARIQSRGGSQVWVRGSNNGDYKTNGGNSDNIPFPRETIDKKKYARIYASVYLPQRMLNKTLTIRISGTICDTGNDNGDSFTSETSVTTSFSSPNIYINSGSGWQRDGSYNVSVSTDNRKSGSTYKAYLQTSRDGSNWYDTGNIYTGGGSSFNIAKEKLASPGGYSASKQQWADGIKMRWRLEYKNYPSRSDEVYTYYSSTMSTTHLTPISGAPSLSLENRNLVVGWDVYRSSSSSSQHSSGFQIDRYNNNRWEKVGTVSFSYYNSHYTFNYPLPPEDCNVGDRNFKFRVWRTTFSSPEIHSTYQVSSEGSRTFNTNYKKLIFTGVNSIADAAKQQNDIDVKWDFAPGEGIWDDQVTLQLAVTADGVTKTYNPKYNSKIYRVEGLKSCAPHKIQLVVTINGIVYQTINYKIGGKDFVAPDIQARDIVNFETSKGYYNDFVSIKWEVPADKAAFDYFNITRRSIRTGNEVQVAQINHTGLTEYNIQDEGMRAGEVYEYTIEGYSKCDGKPTIGKFLTDYGFSQPYATVSGRITYAGDVAVRGATVAVVGDGEDNNNHSIKFEDNNAESVVIVPKEAFNLKQNNVATFQAWISPTATTTGSAGEYTAILDNSKCAIRFANDAITLNIAGQDRTDTGIKLTERQWNHITAVFDYRKATECHVRLYLNGKFKYETTVTGLASDAQDLFDVHLGNSYSGPARAFQGYMDEIRFWNIPLTDNQVAANYNAYLNGRERGLSGYYRCDIEGVDKLFDLSGFNGIFNKNDADKGTSVLITSTVPSDEQLANKTITDQNGNYLISTIPYTSEGVQYNVIPMLGVHKFSPDKRPVFASPASVTFNGVDFEDKSSFDVTGVVYYENTLYPVEGCELYIDGLIAARDGRIITTDEKGEFRISVPIGDHFIEVRKHGHTFVNAGRIPADPDEVGLRRTFDQPLHGLKFYDNTKVTVTGRVSGGKIEDAKPLGLQQSRNNIGRATITLSTGYKMNVMAVTDEASSDYIDATEPLSYANSTSAISSHATVGAGSPEAVQTITIVTDSITGEFAAEMPPVEYSIDKVEIKSNPEIVFTQDKLGKINATQVLLVNTDSVEIDGNIHRFEYNVATRINYLVEKPSFEVSQNVDGSFGDKEFKYYSLTSDKPEIVPLYTKGEDGSINYTFTYPVFLQQKYYTFNIYGFEKYVNYDAQEPVIDKVPLQNNVVTITNQFAAGQKVYVGNGETPDMAEVDGKLVDPENLEENQLRLDENGRASYQFMTGYPNINDDHTLGLNITYDLNGREMQWNQNGKFRVIVLGSLPSGSNFVTAGPDKVLMILRDPAGTGSSAYFEKGVTISTTENDGGSFVTNDELTTNTALGAEIGTVTGTLPGVANISEASTALDLEVGAVVNIEKTKYNENVTTTTTTERISTSDTEDFVGANGDVFIGASTNMIFGNARTVNIRKVDGQFVINKMDEISVGQNFATGFKFTQHYIENTLIPNLYLNRNAKIQHVTSIQDVVNNGKTPIYVSTLNPEDERYGSNNFDKDVWHEQAAALNASAGPSYTMIPPVGNSRQMFQDTIRWFNTQIELWEKTLADNERAKLEAIQDEGLYLKENHSFDAGAIIESSITQTTAATKHDEYMVEEFMVVGGVTGFELNGTGVTVTTKTQTGGREFGFNEETQENSLTTGYVLSESGYNDALTVDVFDAPDGFGPIFRTRGGQTSCPYEDAVVTKYYQPGTEISAATMRVEIPRITVDNAYATDIPSGKAANYTLKIENLSETGDDVWFDLAVDDYSNQSAAITIDGATITKSRPILVKSGQTVVKTLQIKQTRLDVLDFRNINVVLKSQCQGDPTGNFPHIADTVSLSATFVPSCSDITLQIDNRVINTTTGTTLPIVIKDFDRSFDSFKGIRLQYKDVNDADWRLIKEYMVNPEDVREGSELLQGSKVSCNFDMKNTALYPDGKYMFRAITICQFGNEEVNNESELITVSKDTARPQLLGNPSPANGILTADGELSVTFNEDIKSAALSEPVNFLVRGRLNGYRVDHNTAVRFTGSEGAATQADIDLANHSFAVNLWVNVSSEGAGQILSHGNATNKFVVSCDAAGIITVSFSGKQYRAENAIPLDRWVFLSIALDSETDILTASAFNDASTITLIDNVLARPYTGNGIIRVGQGFKGIIHELTLWNYARPLVEAQSQMYASKSPKTPHLIGYWRMDEGHGSQALDLVRNRHITFSEGNQWFIAVENKAVALDGTAHLAVNTTICSPSSGDDFMFELWFNAAAEQGNVATLFSTGLGFGVQMRNGRLELIGSDGNISLGNDSFNDNVWHHFAVNVLRHGMTTVYVDGRVLKQFASVNVGKIASDHIIIGADRRHPADNENTYEYFNYFKGMVDEVRLWNASLSADFIRGNRFARLLGDNAGLVAYYPFEKTEMDESGLINVNFDYSDHSVTGSNPVTAVKAVESRLAPGLKAALALKNVEFGFVASERKVVINLEEAADIIEGTTLEFTLREVRDLTDNYSQPITWTAYVNRNLLRWADTELSVSKNNLDAAHISTSIVNNGGTVENWTLSNVPFWLTADVDGGSVDPLGQLDINFTVSESLPVGTYEETVYLVGNSQIYEPLVVSVTVTGSTPEWNVNPNDFESSMNIIGQLKFENRYSENPSDIIAAFIGDRCVGMASPVYYADYDAYFVHMTVYNNVSVDGKADPVTFKAWEASTGSIRPVVQTSEEVTFRDSRIYGSLKAPFFWNATSDIEQPIALRQGWNWISTFVSDPQNTVAHVFDAVRSSMRVVKDKDSFTSYSADTDSWRGDLKDFEANKMYKANTAADEQLLVVGRPVTPSQLPVTIRSTWNWIGYNSSFNSSIADAFAGLNPKEDDLVKDHRNFSVFNGYRWIGTLTTLVPGRGYMYKSAIDGERTFTFPDQPAAQRHAPMRVIRNAAEHFTVVDNAKYPGNMTMIAVVMNGDQVVYDSEVGVFAGRECRGAAKSEQDGLLFITVAGDENSDKLSLSVRIGSDNITPKSNLVYVDDAMHGTLDEPYIIQIDENATGLDSGFEAEVNVYVQDGILHIDGAGEYNLFNAAGQLIYTGSQTEQTLPKGVYMLQIGDETRKVVL